MNETLDEETLKASEYGFEFEASLKTDEFTITCESCGEVVYEDIVYRPNRQYDNPKDSILAIARLVMCELKSTHTC